MFHTKVMNPNTNKEIRVRGWHVVPKEVLAWVKQGLTTKQISWKFLGDKEVEQDMRQEFYGDTAESNLALSVFENALDWSIGLSVLRIIRDTVKTYKKLPKPFEILVSRKGDVFARIPSGKVLCL